MKKNKIEKIIAYIANNFMMLFFLWILISTYNFHWMDFLNLLIGWLLIILIMLIWWNYIIYKKYDHFFRYFIAIIVIITLYDNQRHEFITEKMPEWYIIIDSENK